MKKEIKEKNICLLLLLSLVLTLCPFANLVFAIESPVIIEQTVISEGTSASEGTPGGGAILPINATPPEVYDVLIYAIDLHSASISWKTDEVCVAEILYGKTANYELGSIPLHPDSYEKSHNISLYELQAGTKYYIKIKVKNQRGIENIAMEYGFYTTPEFFDLPSVGSLTANQIGNKVFLNWINPVDKDFQGVQINRTTGSPALSHMEGERIFFGVGTNFWDDEVLDRTKYYYTIFAFDFSNNFSSGVATSITTDFLFDNEKVPDEPVVSPEIMVDDVKNLNASANVEQKKVTLSWEYADNASGLKVEIRRDVNFPSTSPWEGDLVYSGSGTSFEDTNLIQGQVYFYTVYVKNSDGVYSSGKFVAFELQDSATPVSEPEGLRDFSFVDVESGVLLVPNKKGQINITSSRTMGVSYGLEILPDNLKAVGVQLGESLYLLDYDENAKAYRASFMVPEKMGEYDMALVFLDFEDNILFKREIQLQVVASGSVWFMHNEPLFKRPLSWDKLLCRFKNLLGGENIDCLERQNAVSAKIDIYQKSKDGDWALWNAQSYNQSNPVLSDEYGEFVIFVPYGEYKLVAGKGGFKEGETIVHSSGGVINADVQIYMKKDLKYVIILLVVLFLIVNVIKKLRKEKK